MQYINSAFVLVLVNDHIYNHIVIIEQKEINNTINSNMHILNNLWNRIHLLFLH